MTPKVSFDVPAGAGAKVHIIDSGFRMSKLPTSFLFSPEMDQFDILPPMGSWSFLIESSTGRKVLFDLGGPCDINSFPPYVANLIETVGVQIQEAESIADILAENSVEPAHVESVIWSHVHWDHVGDITAFPSSTELVVGPGFKEAFYPGYPTKQDVELPEVFFKGRNTREIDFSDDSAFKTGAFTAIDFFGDGSFFLLDAPGHSIGHLAALARTTTKPDTFIFMGADLCHHGAEIRPSSYLPIPAQVQLPCIGSVRSHFPECHDDALFTELNVKQGRKPDEPFFDPTLYVDLPKAVETIKRAQEADVQSNIFFIFAHDMSICEVVDFFPKSANDWKHKGWKEKSLWNFLTDLIPAALSSR